MRSSLPYLQLSVLSHPANPLSADVAGALRDHFAQDPFQGVAGNLGIRVRHRSQPHSTELAPPVLDRAEESALMPVLDSTMASDDDWLRHVAQWTRQAVADGALVLPVMTEDVASEIPLEIQALRFYRWDGTIDDRCRRLVRETTHELIRHLRHRLHRQTRPESSDSSLSEYAQKIQVFISHSKHDGDGEAVALAIRQWLHDNSALQGLVDVHDIPAGLQFEEMLLHQVRNSAVITVYSDSFSKRKWCRTEVIEAKRHLVPMLVVDCLRDRDHRCLPYLGGVPVVRVCPDRCDDRVDIVVQRLLDEILLSYLWDNRIRELSKVSAGVRFIYRPPEPLSMMAASLSPGQGLSTIVYPGPVLESVDLHVMEHFAPNVEVVPMGLWRRI